MASWNESGVSVQYAMPPNVRRDAGYDTFTAATLTKNVYTYMTEIYSGMLQYRTAGDTTGSLFDVPLTSPFTIANGYFTVTRPSTLGEDSTFWYIIWGE